MVELDGDEVRISSRGRFAERDIVQVGSGAFNVYPKLKTLRFLLHLEICSKDQIPL